MTNDSGANSSLRELEGPPFRAPWEAQVFALICALQDSGKLSPADWSARLGNEIRLARERGDPDLGDTYYVHCLAALEKWLLQADLAGREEIGARIAEPSCQVSEPQGGGG